MLIPWQGWSLSEHDFLVTRLMEIVVHSDDLAASIGVVTPEFPAEVLAPVLDLLTGLAVRRHGSTAVVRTLARPQRAPRLHLGVLMPDERAPYDPMPHGPAEVGVGPWPGEWPTGQEYDAQLLAEGDRRNVVDRYRYWRLEAIVADLDTRRHDFHVAIENWQHDFNIGTVVRTANAFLAAEVHIVGNRRWNRRGAMVTDRYQHLRHHATAADLATYLRERGVLPSRHRQPPGLGPPRDDGDAASGVLPVRAGGAGALRRRARGVRRDVLDRAVRLDPLHQRLGGRCDRHAHLGACARRSG